MLLVLRPADAAGQFQVGRDIVIGLTESGIGIQDIGILAQKIIVPLIVEAAERIGVDIKAFGSTFSAQFVGYPGFLTESPPIMQFELSDTPGTQGSV